MRSAIALEGIGKMQKLDDVLAGFTVEFDELKTGHIPVRKAFLVAPDYFRFKGQYAVDQVNIETDEVAVG